jgi:hypothetical protein
VLLTFCSKKKEEKGSCENGELSCLFVCFLKNEANEEDTKKRREKFFVQCEKKRNKQEKKRYELLLTTCFEIKYKTPAIRMI